jgi:hypothetical protein
MNEKLITYYLQSAFFCRVKLAINQTTEEAIAVKIINLKQVACPDDIRKEVYYI